MTEKEKRFINIALKYKNQYRQCSWWKIVKRRRLYGKWKSALDLAIKHSK